MPDTRTQWASSRVLLSVPGTVMGGRRRLALHYRNSPQDGLIVAFPQNLLKEVKSTLNAGIWSYFVHVLKEGISHLPSSASYQASLCLASLHSPSTCLNWLDKIHPGQEIPMKMLLQTHTLPAPCHQDHVLSSCSVLIPFITWKKGKNPVGEIMLRSNSLICWTRICWKQCNKVESMSVFIPYFFPVKFSNCFPLQQEGKSGTRVLSKCAKILYQVVATLFPHVFVYTFMF